VTVLPQVRPLLSARTILLYARAYRAAAAKLDANIASLDLGDDITEDEQEGIRQVVRNDIVGFLNRKADLMEGDARTADLAVPPPGEVR